MHYRTHRTGFLETEEEFTAAMEPHVLRVEATSFDTDALERGAAPLAVIPAAP